MRKALLLVLSLIVSTGCFDFVEPDLPEAGAPAILQAAIHVDSDGTVQFDGLLAPALTVDGFERVIQNDTIRVFGIGVGSDSVLPNSSRIYHFNERVPAVGAQPISLEAPDIEDVLANPPVIRWQNIRRIDADTIMWQAPADLVLRIAKTESSEPAPQGRQWIVDLISEEGNFRIGSNGIPPDSIRIPAYYVPASALGRVSAVLTYFQNGTYRVAPGDYVLALTTDTRARWTILVKR